MAVAVFMKLMHEVKLCGTIYILDTSIKLKKMLVGDNETYLF